MLNVWRIRRDVTGPKYVQFLRVLLELSSEFGLVSRPELGIQASASQLFLDLEPFKIRSVKTGRWPGTSTAQRGQLSLFTSDQDAATILERPGSLYSWCAPSWPEDLFFKDSKGEILTALVAHEKDAWILSAKAASSLGQVLTLERETMGARDEKLVLGVA